MSEARLSDHDRQLLAAGKAEHRGTTVAVRRALQVAENTGEVARGTLVELYRQGRQLEHADVGIQQVGQEVKEASAILRFMRRWCCFQCACCWDPTANLDRSRKSRVALAQKDLAFKAQNLDLHYAGKQQAVARRQRQHDPAYGDDEPAARHELFAEAGAIRAARHGPPTPDIGYGLPEADRQEIRKETEQQDELIARIGDAVASLHTMSKEMHGEMAEQQLRIDSLQDRATKAHDELGSMMRDVRRI